MQRLERPALVWVFRHPKLLLLTAEHVAVDILLVAAIVFLIRAVPVAAVLLLLPALYLGAFAAVLTDAAIIAAVHDRMTIGRISHARVWAIAWEHRNALAAWAVRVLFVGLAIRILAATFGRFGRLFGWAAEIAWTIVALLVVPAIVVDDIPMPEALARSRHTLRQTFGDRLKGVTGLTIVGVVIALSAIALLVAAALADSATLIVVWWAGCVALLVAYAFVFDAAMAVLAYAIYAHAAQHPLPRGFTDATIRESFRVSPSPSP